MKLRLSLVIKRSSTSGASRGIGKEIATQLSKTVGEGSVLVLTARSADKLEELEEQLLQV